LVSIVYNDTTKSWDCALDVLVHLKDDPNSMKKRVYLNFTVLFDQNAHISLLYPIDPLRPAYTHKISNMKINDGNKLYFEKKKINLDSTIVYSDWTKSFESRYTVWKWIFFSGRLTNGSSISLNACPPGRFEDKENALWIDNMLHMIGTLDIILPQAGEDFFTIQSVDNEAIKIHLKASPISKHSIEKNVIGILKVNFKQSLSKISGTITINKKQEKIENVYGIIEEHTSLW